MPKIRKLQCKPRPRPRPEVETEDEVDIDENDDLKHPGQFLRLKTARRNATFICEGLKLLFTPFVSYLVSRLLHVVNWSDLKDGFNNLGSNHDTVFAYFLVNIFVSFLGYILGIVTCSMAMQKISFAFPITFITPISFLIALGCEKHWWASDWLFEQQPDITERQLIVAICVFVFPFFAQFLSTTYYIWRSQDFIMVKESRLFWVPSYNGMYIFDVY